MLMEHAERRHYGLRTSVLVLNRLWRAVRVVDAKRAFHLLFRDAAEVIRVDDGSYAGYDLMSWINLSSPGHVSRPRHPLPRDDYDWVQAVRFRVAIPHVVRLTGYDRLPAQSIKLTRRNIFARDRHRCQYCRREFPHSQLSVDHVIPRSQGGRSTWENLVCCCRGCNTRKGGRTPDQAQMRLAGPPAKPKQRFLMESRLSRLPHAHWRPFLERAGHPSDGR